jgi:hypothetical protein
VTSLGWQRKKSTVPVGVGVPERVAWSVTEVPGATSVAFVLACVVMSGGPLTEKHSLMALVWSPPRLVAASAFANSPLALDGPG